MVSTVVAVVLLAVVVLPGAVATFAYERSAGPIREADNGDRIIRFVVVTSLLSPLVAVTTWMVWARLLHVRDGFGPTVTYRNLLRDGDPSIGWALLPPVYVIVAAVAGWLTGLGRRRWLARQVGRTDVRNAPASVHSWDMLFGDDGAKVVSCRLRDGQCVGGVFGRDSRASVGSAVDKEIVIEQACVVDEFAVVKRDEDGVPVVQGLGGALRVREADILFLRVEAP